jgi:hypothetical protein
MCDLCDRYDTELERQEQQKRKLFDSLCKSNARVSALERIVTDLKREINRENGHAYKRHERLYR